MLGAEVRLHGERQRAHVGAAVERASGNQHREHPAALPHRNHRIGVDRGDRPVPARPETHGLAGRSAAATVELLGMPVIDESHGPACDPRELGRRERLETRALLGSEGAADELRQHADVILAEAERLRELVACREHPLRRHPGGEAIAVPERDGGVRLERAVHLRGCLELELDPHLGGGERRLSITAGVVARIRGKALLVQGLLRVDDVREHLEVEGESHDTGLCRLQRVRRDDRDRLAGIAGLDSEKRGPGRQRKIALRSGHGPHTRHAASSVEVERADASVGDG